METRDTTNEAFYKNLLSLWLAFFVSPFLFLVVIYFVSPSLFSFSSFNPIFDQNYLIVVIFAVAAILNLTASFIFRQKFLHQAIRKQEISIVQNAVLVGCVLCETVALFGFMLAFVAEYQYFFVWFLLSLFGMLFHFPSKKHIFDASLKKTT